MADSTPTTSIAPDLTSREKAADKEVDMTQVAANAEKKAPKPKKEPKNKPSQQPKAQKAKKEDEGTALIGITAKKEVDLADWYQQVILKGEMLEFSDIPGCYIYWVTIYD
jgi:prolyl-tRNA synthetase